MSTTHHHAYIDGLRALAIIAVVLFHLDRRLLPGGYAGVDIFFVISGLVVASALYRLQTPTLGAMLAAFYLRRLKRILPALLAMLIVVHFAVVLLVPQAQLSNSIAATGVAAFWGVSNFVLAGKADYFSPLAHYNPFTHTWSLAVEEQFYVLFPFLLFVISRGNGISWRSFTTVAALCGLSLAYGGYEARSGAGMGFYSSAGRFWEIGSGVLLFIYFTLQRGHDSAEQKLLTWSGAALVIVTLVFPMGGTLPVPGALLAVAGTVLLMLGLHQREPTSIVGDLLASKSARLVGLISYSLYLWHWPIFVLARWTSGFSTPAEKFVALAVAVAFSVASYVLVEQPLRTSMKLRQAAKVIPVAVAATVASFGLTQLARQFAASLSLSSPTRFPESWYPYDPVADASGCRGTKTEMEQDSILSTELVNACNGNAKRGRLHVLGDSHAGAYIRMLDDVARQEGFSIHIREVKGCSVATLASPPDTCERSTAQAIKEVAAELRPGDVVFLPGLRVPRRYEQSNDGLQDAEALMQQWAVGEAPAVERAKMQLAPLIAKSVPIIFELPKPVFDAPAYRCTDWFNGGNEACAGGMNTDKAGIERLRAPVLAMAQQLAAEVPELVVWDPLPTLCPATPCSAFSGEVPLFFDADHLSGAGSAKLADNFISVLVSLRPR